MNTIFRTDNGLKFVPGMIVETSNGSAIFVPAQVLDSPEGARLLKGHVVDTEDGPRLLPPDIKGSEGKDLSYIVQGFDIDQMEARLILGGHNEDEDVSDILDGKYFVTTLGYFLVLERELLNLRNFESVELHFNHFLSLWTLKVAKRF